MARGDTNDVRRVEVGFKGGQVIAMRLAGKRYEDLRKAAQSRDGWYEAETPDGVVSLDLGEVVFVRIEVEEHRIGFSGRE